MTDEVAAQVLGDNHAQNATLAVEVASSRSLLDAHERLLRSLERSGRLVRSVEALPDERALVERRRDGQALTSPELSVLLAYAKLETGDVVLKSGLPDDPAFEDLLTGYFPAQIRERFPTAISTHALRREIVATALTNRAVNVAGVTGLFRLVQETGVPLDRVVLAHAVARAVFDVDRLWDAVRPLDNEVAATTQVELRTEATRLAERTTRWLLRQPELAAQTAPLLADVRDRFVAPVDRRPGGPARLAARQRGRGVRGAGDPAAGGRRPRGARRRDRRRAAAARRPGPRGRHRADRGAGRAGRSGDAVPGGAAGPGAAAGDGDRAAAGPPLAVDGPRLAAGRPRHGAGLAHRGRAEPAEVRHRGAGERWWRRGRRAGTARRSAPPRSSPTSPRGTGTSWPSCWSPSARCAGLRRRRIARRQPRPAPAK